MHLALVITAGLIAILIRLLSQTKVIKYEKNWGLSLFCFAFPSLILVMTCMTVIFMGYHGQMWGMQASLFSYLLALAYLLFITFTLVTSIGNLVKLCDLVETYPSTQFAGKPIKILDSSFPYAAQVGFWRSHLVISTGMIELLSPEHLEAVIAHETAHQTYRDPFFFFWLSFLHKASFCLPHNEKLWRNLLLLRELRADQTAAGQVDSLLIAESLVQVTAMSAKQKQLSQIQLALECPFNDNRLEERINNLLETNHSFKFNWTQIIWIALLFIPFALIPFHIS